MKKFTKSKFLSVILKFKDTMYKFETFQIYNEDIQNKTQISNYKFHKNSKFHLLYSRFRLYPPDDKSENEQHSDDKGENQK